jgi:hypothetical protein
MLSESEDGRVITDFQCTAITEHFNIMTPTGKTHSKLFSSVAYQIQQLTP